ncbi:MAG TPA: hypothetical protein VIU38_03240 [Anaerolineales bacterium]
MKSSALHRIASGIPKGLAFFLVSMILLVLGFYRNAWMAAGPKRFIEWQRLSDAPIVGRLAESRQAGIFSYGGLIGFGDKADLSLTGMEYVDHQYDVYENGGQFAQYLPYPSVIGAQGIAFGLLDRLTSFAPGYQLKLLRGLMAVLSAAVLSLLVLWLYHEFGWTAAVLSTLFMLLSEWLTFYGGSLYWAAWAFYLPVAAMGLYLFNPRHRETDARFPALLITGTVLTKCLFNGFEFITPPLLMIFAPILYYALNERWPRGHFVAFSIKTAAYASLGVLIALAILLAQGAAAEGGWAQSVGYLAYTIGKRTLGSPESYSGVIADSLSAPTGPVLWNYVVGRAIILPIGRLMPFAGPALPRTVDVSYLFIFILFLVITAAYLLTLRGNAASLDRSKVLALMATTWLSLLAPLSWFVLFKAHAYIHSQLDFIVWQMPFTLLGFGLCGAIIRSLVATARPEPLG